LRVRRATAADIPAIMAVAQRALTSGQWSRQQYEDIFLVSEPESKRFAWVLAGERGAPSEGPDSASSETLAFLVARRIEAEWELENIAVDADARHKGVGALLLRELIAHARGEQGESIFLEVRQSNQSARAFYEKLGFAEAGCRKNYYASPTEDAILYRLNLR
jgi:[ribosomal protein S18]-alanine N-acetyltransferase